jgi:hypothetical protein
MAERASEIVRARERERERERERKRASEIDRERERERAREKRTRGTTTKRAIYAHGSAVSKSTQRGALDEPLEVTL